MTPNTKPFDSAAEEIADSRDVVNLQVIETTIADLRKSARTIIERREDRKTRRKIWRQELVAKVRRFWDHLSLPILRSLFHARSQDPQRGVAEIAEAVGLGEFYFHYPYQFLVDVSEEVGVPVPQPAAFAGIVVEKSSAVGKTQTGFRFVMDATSGV